MVGKIDLRRAWICSTSGLDRMVWIEEDKEDTVGGDGYVEGI